MVVQNGDCRPKQFQISQVFFLHLSCSVHTDMLSVSSNFLVNNRYFG